MPGELPADPTTTIRLLAEYIVAEANAGCLCSQHEMTTKTSEALMKAKNRVSADRGAQAALEQARISYAR